MSESPTGGVSPSSNLEADARRSIEKGGPSRLAFLRAPEWGLMVGIACVLGVIYKLDPSLKFFGMYSLQTMVHNSALYGVLALGAALVIIAGGIDLSVGSVVALSSVVAAKLLTSWLPGLPADESLTIPHVAVAVAAVLALGLLVGLVHALMINEFRLPPFIATLATMAGLRSVAILISRNRSINVSADTFRALGNDTRFTLPIFVSVAIAVGVMMGMTVLGRHLYALGGNETAARLSGLKTKRLKMIAYGLSGMLSALGGILFTGNSGQFEVKMGASYELFAITAAVVGGCSLSGGVGSIRGTVLGLILIQIVIKGTALAWEVPGVDSTQIEGLVLGTVVVLAVAFNQSFRRRG